MTLTPLDIKRQQFARSFRGYDTAEVDAFVKQVADRVETVLDQLRAAEDRVRDLEARLVHYERVEMALQEALQSARETAAKTDAAATDRARATVASAEARAMQITADAERERYEIRQDISRLTSRQAEVAARLRGFLLSELEVLAHFQGDDPVGFLQLRGSRTELVGDGRPAGADARADDERTTYQEAPTSPSEPVEASPADEPEGETGASAAPGFAHHVAAAASADTLADLLAEEDADASGEQTASKPQAFEPQVPEHPAADASASWPPADDAEPAEPVPFDPQPSASAPELDLGEASEPASASEPAEEVGAFEIAPDAEVPLPFGWRESSVPEPAISEPVSSEPASSGAPASPDPAPPVAGWSLRSLVTGDDPAPVAASDAERERIRRILDDLD